MSTPKQIAVCAISPIHFISAIGVCRSLHGINKASIDLLVHWPGIDDRSFDAVFKIFLKLSAAADEVRRIVAFNQASVNELCNFSSDHQLVEAVQSMTQTLHYDEIYYPHDVVGDLYPVLTRSYPDARRVCIGDGLGNVYERKVHLSYLGLNPETDPMFGFHAPDMAALFLPVDQSGNFLKKVPLLVCPKRILEEVIEQCIAATYELQDYIQIILNAYQGRPKILLLTENNAEGGFIDFDREVEMYAEMILPLIEKNSVVLIKPHPGETLPRSRRIQEILKSKAETVELHEKFNRYPIELCIKLMY